ncbi:hypothetical protein N7481_011925 [Penicillium waksmanii]|uniref:uncharacterized protein n=1 Tax=Penicillium waksmanii TaxID=69791 RepID=UPI0025470275|nr:uncharacterized protein N7481_011925 [Penicillium waksmanii]KAJ5974715.1 hypothetical protein N7481_011925 [Penicillium waksmanii]
MSGCYQKHISVHSAPPEKHNLPGVSYPRWFGGSASCMAVVVSHPFDLIKVRMQAIKGGANHGFVRIGFEIVKGEGMKGLYCGVLTYGTTRIALYEEFKKMGDGRSMDVPTLAGMAAISGFCGALVGTPSDIANIRMQNDRSLPPAYRRNYRNVIDAWLQMKRTEGWKSFAQGLWPNCFRCAIMTTSQLVSYDIFKTALQWSLGSKSESTLIHLSASLLASLVATTLVSPMDVIRTQLMSSSQRTSLWRILQGLMQADGCRWVFRGWTPSFVRLGPQTMATLVFLEQHRKIYRSWKGYKGIRP